MTNDEHRERVAFELEKLAHEIRGGKYKPDGLICLIVERQHDDTGADRTIVRDHGLSWPEIVGHLHILAHSYAADQYDADDTYDDPLPSFEPES